MALIARLFSTEQTAAAAAASLREEGYDDGTEIITAAGSADEALLARLTQAGVAPAHADIFAWHVRSGEALLLTRPMLTRGWMATQILDRCHPVPATLPLLEHPPTPAQRAAAPLSTRFGLPVLLSDAAPLSRSLGMGTLTPSPATPAKRASNARQSRQAAPFSRLVHAPILSSVAAPLSRLLAWRPLWDRATPLSTLAKFRPLWDRAAPLSRGVKLPVLLAEPALLSKRTVAHEAAPFSKLLGVPVLTKRQ